MTMELRRVAEECCDGRIVMVTEGGYDLHALAGSLECAIQALAAPDAEVRWPTSEAASDRGRRAAAAVKPALAAFWTLQ
jgi:acetoin utilization deacetylase AcuC-like enzyme